MFKFINVYIAIFFCTGLFFQIYSATIIHQITEENFKQNVEESSLPVFMMLTASWCPKCIHLNSLMTALLDNFNDRAIFASIDVDKENNFLQILLNDIFQKHFQIIGGFPVVLVFNKGVFVKYLLGFYKDQEDLKTDLDKILCELAK